MDGGRFLQPGDDQRPSEIHEERRSEARGNRAALNRFTRNAAVKRRT